MTVKDWIKSANGHISAIIYLLLFSIFLVIKLISISSFDLINVILGAPIALFLPGWIVTYVIFADQKNIGFIERTLLGSAFSVTLVSMISYVLNLSPWSINSDSVFFVLFIITTICAIANVTTRNDTFRCKKISIYHVLLAIILIFGSIVRLIPFFRVDTFIDLDPYNHFMKANNILSIGRIPTSDVLLNVSQGGDPTYLTPLGFEFIVITLELITHADPVKLMGLLPVFYGALTVLSIFLLSYEITSSKIASLFAASFAALPTSWSLIYSISMNPLSENIGIYLFSLAILFLSRYAKEFKEYDLICLCILFGTMIYIHLFTVIFFVLVCFSHFVIMCFQEKKERQAFLKGIVKMFVLGLLIALPVLVPLVSNISHWGFFSSIALKLAFASSTYMIVLPQDLAKMIPPSILLLAIIKLALIFILLKTKRKKEELLLASHGTALILATFANLVEPLRIFMSFLPFGGCFLFSHRVIPYLSLSFYLLAALTVSDHILPLVMNCNHRFNLMRKSFQVRTILLVAFTFLILASPLITSLKNATELAYMDTPKKYVNLFGWIEKNTNDEDIVITNNWDVSMWLMALIKRPVVFTHVNQFLALSDAEQRIVLHSFIFNPGFDSEARQLLKKYNVSYVVVMAKPMYCDIFNNRWVWSIPDITDYLRDMEKKNYLEIVFSEENAYVYRVKL